MKGVLKSFSAAFIANIVNLLVTVFITFYIPKFSGVEEYAQWQLYLFYISYLWILAFGWPDGIYLRCGGKPYETLDRQQIKLQFVIMTVYLGVIIPGLISFTLWHPNFVVLIFFLIDSAIEIPREALSRILQATGRTADNSKMIICSRLLFLVLIITKTFFGDISFFEMALLDITTKIIALSMTVYFCRDIMSVNIRVSKHEWKLALQEFRTTLFCGSQLMFGGLCALFIVGIVRMAIQNHWGLVAFGKVSLTLSISNLFSVFIGAVSLVLFPALKNAYKDSLVKTYITIENLLTIIMFGALIFYYPARQILDIWLPQYRDGLQYMAILFPVCVYQSKTSLLANTYQKALGQEKWILIVNVGVVVLSALTAGITVYLFNSLDLAIFSIVVLLIIRNLLSELTVWKVLGLNRTAHVLEELALTIIFITASWFIGGVAGLAVYAVAYVVYLVIKRKDVQFAFNTVKRLVGRK